MEFLIYYTIFVLATTIYAYIFLLAPTVKKVYNHTPVPNIVAMSGSGMVMFALIICSLLAAPALFFVCIIPSFSKTFCNGLFNELKKS